MTSRWGIIGGVVGGVAAAGTTAAVARRSRTITRARRGIAGLASPFEPLPADRGGTLRADDGVALAYEEAGPPDAPLTVVLVHGFCLTMDEWWFQRRDLMQRFGADVRVVLYDQRSHGRSGSSSAAHDTIDQLGRDLATVLRERVPDGPLVLVGHSMGGMTIMALAGQQPGLFASDGRVSGVGFVATSAGLRKVSLGLPRAVAGLETPAATVLLKFARWQGNTVERGRRLSTNLAWAITQRLSFFDPAVDPATIDFVNGMISSTRVEVIADFFPTLVSHDKTAALTHLAGDDVEIVVGDNDLLLPLAHSKVIAKALPDATFTVVPDAGHLVNLERPDVVSEILNRLVQRSLPARTEVAS